ncbi:small-subunit processome [Glomus cerebriforme]|uniref:Small-subunit processome n=1 Tax=Glomus cerebriforme TaxID=658196 RepID=A0A397TGD8_9GLOM|nr:small-subunit processome [Glomus cerebriforme]
MGKKKLGNSKSKNSIKKSKTSFTTNYKNSGPKNSSKSKQPKNPNKISGKDIFEIDQEETKQERRRRNIDEIESYEYAGAEKIEKKDDEEIDSDEAFNDSDEERFEHFIFRGSNQKDIKKQLDKEIDLDETEEDDDDNEESELDEDDEEDQEDEREVARKSIARFVWLDESDNDESEMDEEFKALMDNDVQEIDDETKADKLASFIGSLDKKRKRTIDDEISSLEKPKKQLKERTEAYEESEYNLATRESSNIRKKIDLHDLIGSIQEETGFSGLKQKLASLESGGNKGTYKEPLSAPLPPRIQDRLNRQAAYEKVNKDITKWEPIVKQNREAEHLKFPMNAPLPHKQTNNVLASMFQPVTELEKEIDSMLVESGVKEKNLQQYEELQMSKLSVEEVEKRVKELRKMRELAFREEIKGRRIAKIKSKTYRKIRKKEKNKLDLKQLAELDPKLAREEQLRLERARAQERMTLKHKNTSKWAKQALKHGRHDLEGRQAIAEQLQRHEELKRKIHDLGSDEELDDFSSENSDEKDDDIDAIKEKAFDELAQLERKETENEEMEGLFGMKFMRIAMDKEKYRTRGMIDDFIEDLENEENSTKDEKTKKEVKKSTITHVGNNPGRMIFGGFEKSTSEHKFDIKKLSKSIFDLKSSSAEEPKDDDNKLTEPINNYSSEINFEEENPWLQTDSTKIVSSSKKNNKGIIKENNKSDKIVSKLKKQKQGDQSQNGIEIDVDKILTIGSVQNKSMNENDQRGKEIKEINSPTSRSDKASKFKSMEDYDTFDVETNFVHVKNPTAFSQRELVARAFANDNVIKEFEAEKQAIIEDDEPKEQDLTLPGWGSWSGKGVKKPKKKKLVLAKPLPGGIEASKRKDAKLQYVIINEKRIKKAKKYLSTNIPHPFETREQYERSLRTPLGTEWNTQEVFQKIVTPRIITKMGTVIDPLNVPFHTNDLDE